MNLRPYQERAVAAVASALEQHPSTLLVAPTGAGKCLGQGTPVMLASGRVVPVEDVVRGDLLMGPDSRPRQVLSVNRGIGKLYRIVPTKGAPWVCNDVHILTLVHTVTGAIIDMPLDEWQRQSRTFKHCHKLLRRPVETFWGTNAAGDLRSPTVALPLDPYFLGVILGDGTLRHGSLVVSKPDHEIASECRDQAAAFGLRLVQAEARPGKCPGWRFTGRRGSPNPIVERLRAMSLWGVTSDQRFVPDEYRCANVSVRRALLAGLLDTDGCATHGGFDWISKSETLADDICFIARSLGLAAYKAPCHKRCQTGAVGKYFRVSISGDCSTIPVRIPRRKNPPREQKKDVLRVGFAIEPCGQGDYFGFTLAADGRFLLGDFTVTHNTVMLAHVAKRHGGRVLVLQHRDELVSQNRSKFQRVNPSWPTSIYTAAQKRFAPQLGEGSATFAMVPTIVRNLARMVPHDLIMIDECHHAPAPSFMKTLARARELNPDVKVFGVTATPLRADRKGLGDVFANVADVITMGELIDSGHLVKPVARVADIGLEQQIRGVRRATGGDFDMSEVARLIDHEPITRAVIGQWRIYAGARRTVIFCSTVAHAQHVRDCFIEAGVRAGLVTGADAPSLRAATLRALDRGDLQVVVNVFALTEGWDCPPVSCVVLLRPSSFESCVVQMIGRGLRIIDPAIYPDEPPKLDCEILDFGASLNNLGGLDQIMQLGKTIEREPGPPLTRSCPDCRAAIPISSRECPLCGAEIERHERPVVHIDPALITLRTVDILLKQSPFAWYQVDERWKIAMSPDKAWAIAFADRENVWHAVAGTIAVDDNNRRTYAHPTRLASGTQAVALSAADDFLGEHGDPSRHGRRSGYMRLDPTDGQMDYARSVGVDPGRLTRYELSCRLTAKRMGDRVRHIHRAWCASQKAAA